MSFRLLAIKEFLFNPILEKDLRSTARSPRFFIFILAFLLIAGIVLLFLADDQSAPEPGTGLELFTGMFVMQAICVAVAIPAYACTTVAAERQHRTFDLLRITSLQPWHIVWGKFIAIMSYIAVFIFSFLPLVSICFLYGGVDPLLLALAYVYLLMSTATCAAFCLMLSAASSNTIKSVIVGYIFMIVAAIIWYMIGYELLEEITRRGLMTMPKELVASLITLFLSLAFFWTLFYLASTSLLKPPSWNRSTSLRIWFAAFVLVSLGMFLGIFHSLFGPLEAEAVQFYLILTLGIPSLFAAVGFCGEPHALSPRLKAKMAKIPAVFRWFFAPGGWSAALFVRAAYFLAGGAAVVFFWSVGKARDLDEVFVLFLAIFVYINFCCSLASAVRRLWDTPRSRVITISILLALALLPLLAFLESSSFRTAPSIVWISPPMAVGGLVESGLGGDAGPPVFFSFYIIGAVIAFLTATISRSRRRARAIALPAQGHDEAGAPA